MSDYVLYTREGAVLARIQCDDDLMAYDLASGYITRRMTQRFVHVVRDGSCIALVHYDGTVSPIGA